MPSEKRQLSKRLTAIVPAYNSAPFLRDTLNSLCLQTMEVKVLVADGGSSDDTLAIVAEYSDKLSIRVASTCDSGQSDGINRALAQVETTHFFWLNSDDVIFKDFVRRFDSALANQPDLLFATANNVLIDECRRIIKNSVGLQLRQWFLNRGIWFGCFPSVVWNTSAVRQSGNVSTDFQYMMDLELLLRVSRVFQGKDSNRFLHLNKRLGAFRVHSGSKTTSGRHLEAICSERTRLDSLYGIQRGSQLLTSFLVRASSPSYVWNRFSRMGWPEAEEELSAIHRFHEFAL